MYLTSFPIQTVKKLERLAKKYPVFKSRCSHLKAYMNYLSGRERAASKCLAAAVCTADTAGLKYEAAWATRSRKVWFGSNTSTTTMQAFKDIHFYTFR